MGGGGYVHEINNKDTLYNCTEIKQQRYFVQCTEIKQQRYFVQCTEIKQQICFVQCTEKILCTVQRNKTIEINCIVQCTAIKHDGHTVNTD